MLFFSQNHTIERVWVEVNTRVNYPIKSILIAMCENGDINIDDELSKACISWFSVHIASAGAKLFVDAWNNHSIPGNITVILSVPFVAT